MTKYLFFLLVFLVSCGHFTVDGSRRLKESEVPEFLKKLTSNIESAQGVEYYEKHQNNQLIYKVKYKINNLEISVKADEQGNFIEREEDVLFTTLPTELQAEIHKYLKTRFKSYQIMETEKRTDQNQSQFIDVEIVSSDKEFPFLEISFDLNGKYVSEEVEHVESIETLN